MIDVTTFIADMSGSLLIAGSAFGGIRWYIKHHSSESIKEYLEESKISLAELRPNGGGSLNDAIRLQILPALKEVRDDIKELKEEAKELRNDSLQLTKDVARLEGRMQSHVDDGRK